MPIVFYPELAVSWLSVATICGGRKGEESALGDKNDPADVCSIDRIILIKYQF